VEQLNYNLLFRCFVGMDKWWWNHAVFNKNRSDGMKMLGQRPCEPFDAEPEISAQGFGLILLPL
jgi:hypothetical protein